ncbi:MAG TPA: PadR family transcriptional regulator [Thiolinea sp.]|nr:PadR family transcriptional regulator [Thiolinea sp.]
MKGMFRGHHHPRCARHEAAFEGRGRGRGEHGGRERMFEAGALRLVILHLLQERPRHGYEIIKAIQELTQGVYSPSPGMVYPSLTLLEDMGQAVASEQDGKKQYSITEQGEVALKEQEEALKKTLQRVQQMGARADARRTPELQRPMQNLKMALQGRLERGDITTEVLHKIVDALDQAAITIERS